MDEISFLEKKKYTYLKMQLKEEKIQKLIVSSLLIGIVHDLCKKGNKLFVNEKFIDNCTSKLVLSEGKYLDNTAKFDVIRNKLSHGDYYIHEEMIVFNYQNIDYKISIDSIVAFAKEIANYYQYMNSDIECNSLLITDGIVFKMTDICKEKKRTSQYRKLIEKYKKVRFNNDRKPNIGKQFQLGNKYISITYEVLSYTNCKDSYIENYWGNSLIYIFLNNLSNNEKSELVDGFIDFYINYIYGLDTLLKSNDKSLFAFENDEMFDFSLLEMNDNNTEKNDIVGHIGQYNLNSLYEKLSKLIEKANRINIDELEKETLQREIDRIIRILNNKSIQRLYTYSNIRSEIEHIRCSIMHGTCIKENDNDYLYLYDEYKGNNVFKKRIRIEDFIEFACDKKNKSKIESHISKR